MSLLWGKMPHLVNEQDDVPLSNGFLNFRCAPSSAQGTLSLRVQAPPRFVPLRKRHLVLDAGAAQKKGEFTGLAMR